MKEKHCKYEEQIVFNYLNNNITEEESKHIENCESCAEAIKISMFLNKMGSEIQPPMEISKSIELFSIANTVYKTERQELILKPIKYMNYIFGCLAALMLFTFGYMSKGMVEDLYKSTNITKYLHFSIDLSSISWIYTSILGKLVIAASIVLILTFSLISLFEQIENKHIGMKN